MYRNPRPRQFFNPRAMHMMNRPSGPRFEPGSAGYYPSAPPSQFRYKSSNARGRGYPRSSFPANRVNIQASMDLLIQLNKSHICIQPYLMKA